MKKQVLTITLIALFSFCAIQLSLFALNNKGFGENPYMVGLVSGVSRWANDTDGPLSSGAETDAHSVLDPDTGQAGEFHWDAWAWVHYGGDHINYKGTYHVKVKALDFKREIKNTYKGILDESLDINVKVKPPADGQDNDIDDCEAKGQASGLHPTTRVRSNTESRIPFP